MPSTFLISHSVRGQSRNAGSWAGSVLHISDSWFLEDLWTRSNWTLQGPSTHVSQALKCFIFIWTFLLTYVCGNNRGLYGGTASFLNQNLHYQKRKSSLLLCVVEKQSDPLPTTLSDTASLCLVHCIHQVAHSNSGFGGRKGAPAHKNHMQ